MAGLTAVNGAVYFTAYTVSSGFQVWQSDGTAAGTVMDTDFNRYDTFHPVVDHPLIFLRGGYGLFSPPADQQS